MERIRKYKKEIIGVTLIITIAIGSILIIEPAKLGSQKVAYQDIENKKITLNDLNNKSSDLVRTNNELQNELQETKKEAVQIKALAKAKKAEINDEDLEYHLPSLLIRLENNAIKNKLKLDIDHSGIKEYDENMSDLSENGSSEADENNDNMNSLDTDKQENDEEDVNQEEIEENNIENSGSDRKDENLNNSEKENDEDESVYSGEVPMIYGFKTTIIPLTIEGDFRNVRNFINYIDKVNYVENTSISLISDGEKVVGKILISIFHGSL